MIFFTDQKLFASLIMTVKINANFFLHKTSVTQGVWKRSLGGIRGGGGGGGGEGEAKMESGRTFNVFFNPSLR